MTHIKKNLFLVVLTLIAGGAYMQYQKYTDPFRLDHQHTTDEVHVHADFIVYINGEQLDFSADKYQSTDTTQLHEHIHLHNNDGGVIHRHADNITLSEFFTSLGTPLTDTCFTYNDTPYCTDEENELILYVNNEPFTPISSYITQDADRILLYYGSSTNPIIPSLLESIDDRACIFSGTCPERGTPPPESCGLTCDI